MKKKHIITLTAKQYLVLESITNRGKHKSRVIKRAQVLLKSHEGLSDTVISNHIGISVRTIERIRQRHHTESMNRALYDAPRPGRPAVITIAIEARIVAAACLKPP